MLLAVMKKAFLLLLVLPFLLNSCTKRHDSLIEQQIAQMEKLTKVLNGITDRASADIAKPKITTIKETMAKIKSDMNQLEPPTPEKQAALDKKYGQKMQDATRDLMNAYAKAGLQNAMNLF